MTQFSSEALNSQQFLSFGWDLGSSPSFFAETDWFVKVTVAAVGNVCKSHAMSRGQPPRVLLSIF